MSAGADELARYQRQMLLPAIGTEGQEALRAAHVLIVGCGALGTMAVDQLARAGVGTLTIVDRDIVELTNLQRQTLFDAIDVDEVMPKAEAAKRRIAQVNADVVVHAEVLDFNAGTAPRVLEGVDVIVDGLDNFETRYLLNDLAVRRGLPLVYGGAVATGGMSMVILPATTARRAAPTSRVRWSDEEATPCLRCVFPDAPPPGTSPTCDTAGVLAPAVAVIASWQVAQTIKLLVGAVGAADRSLLSIDVWSNEIRRFDMTRARRDDCPCCAAGRFEFTEGDATSSTTALCGRDAVQVCPAATAQLDLDQVASRLAPHGSFRRNRYMLQGRFAAERGTGDRPLELTLFPDGRAIIKGTTEPDAARSIYAKYVGS